MQIKPIKFVTVTIQIKTMRKLFICSILFLIANKMQAQNQNWSDNIACIMYSHCANCHNPNGIGQGDFTNYTNVFNYRAAIKSAVDNQRMPPYPPNTNYQHYTQERKLSQAEINAIKTWVDNNAPSGNLANAPAAPIFATNYTMLSPDAVYTMPTYTINTMGGDVYRCFPLPSGLTADKFISEIEVIPGNRTRVHHVLVFQDTLNTCYTLDAADPGPGYTSGGTGTNSASLITGWTPGQERYVYPTNFGARLPNASNVIIQIHYPQGILNEKDSTKVLIKFASSAVRNTVTEPILNHGPNSLQNGPLYIPANTTKTFVEKYSVPAIFNATILSVFPHMHKIGRNIKVFAVKPSNDTVPIIDIPKWDFNWQGNYNFQKPLLIPGGSKLWAIADYDNTANNPFNPSNPPQNVSAGEATTDEMMLVYFAYSLSLSGDENIIVDTASHASHYLNCNANLSTGIKEIGNNNLALRIIPNPNNGSFAVDVNTIEKVKLTLVDVSGKIVYSTENYFSGQKITTQHLQKGIYFLKVSSINGDVAEVKKMEVY
jgi:hypothetical protein